MRDNERGTKYYDPDEHYANDDQDHEEENVHHHVSAFELQLNAWFVITSNSLCKVQIDNVAFVKLCLILNVSISLSLDLFQEKIFRARETQNWHDDPII